MSKPPFPVGTRVRIHTDPSGIYAMSAFQGVYVNKESVIIERDDSRSCPFYKLEIDGGACSFIDDWLDEIPEPKKVADKRVERFDVVIGDVPTRPRPFDALFWSKFKLKHGHDFSRKSNNVRKTKKGDWSWWWVASVNGVVNIVLGMIVLPLGPPHGAFNFLCAGFYWAVTFQQCLKLREEMARRSDKPSRAEDENVQMPF